MAVAFKKRLATIQRKIAMERDKLRKQEHELTELLAQAGAVEDDLKDGLDSLNYAIEALSRQQ